jgi:hypothetical protein
VAVARETHLLDVVDRLTGGDPGRIGGARVARREELLAIAARYVCIVLGTATYWTLLAGIGVVGAFSIGRAVWERVKLGWEQ